MIGIRFCGLSFLAASVTIPCLIGSIRLYQIKSPAKEADHGCKMFVDGFFSAVM
jgi:hypothetical protein